VALSVRDGTLADHPVIARLFLELGVPDPVPTAEQLASTMLPRVVVATDGADVIGYAHYRSYGPTAHVAHVVTDPRARGRGVGQALLAAVRARAVAEGCVRWFLNVKKENAPARRLYDRAGLRVEHEAWPLRAEWSSLLALEGARGAVASAVSATATDDERLAERFGVDAGRVALARARPGVVVLVLSEQGSPCAFAAFDPAFPGVYPLAVARLDLARPLFDALHPHARHPHVYVTVERDRALADCLRGAGAVLLFEILRMGAPLDGTSRPGRPSGGCAA